MNKLMRFRDRYDAGDLLAARLLDLKGSDPLILALPRGGVLVASRIKAEIGGRLDTLVVRKLGAPDNPEFGIGAIGPDEAVVLRPQYLEMLGLEMADVMPIIERERDELRRRMKIYESGRFGRSRNDVVVLVDDGLATGVSAHAAVLAAKKLYVPDKLVFAAPVASPEAAAEISGMVDRFEVVFIPPALFAIGEWYVNFPQITDAEVSAILRRN